MNRGSNIADKNNNAEGRQQTSDNSKRQPMFRPENERSQAASSEPKNNNGRIHTLHSTTTNDKDTQMNTKYQENGAGSGGVGSATTIITKVTNQVHQALPTLIIKLSDRKKTRKNTGDLAQDFTQACENFEQTIRAQLDDFRDLIMSARPSPDDPEYEAKRRLYIEMVKGATLMLEHMKKTTDDLFTSFRVFIEDLWDGICGGKDPQKISDKFAKYLEDYMKASWAPMLEKIDRMIEKIDGETKTKEPK